MKRFIHFIAIIILISILAPSCKPKLSEGTVVEMQYEAAMTYVAILPVVISNGKSTSTIMIPYVIHDDEDWVIKVRGISTKGKEVTRKYYISKERYDTLSVGSFICIDGGCSEDDPTYTKTRQ